MAIYFVGDIQGCFSELSLLLEQVKFKSPLYAAASKGIHPEETEHDPNESVGHGV